MVLSEEQEETKRNQEQRNVFFLTEMNLDNGIRKTSVQNYGTFSMEEKIMVNTSEYFQFLTGQK